MRDEILAKLIEKAADIYKTDPSQYNAETRFVEDYNAKSMDIVKIIGALEDEFGFDVNFMEFRRKKTFGEAADYVAGLAN
ncbi:MAG: acyl carrier protein [Saccharofermentanales bacterium]|jgi:acyl carrier protein|nr:acyl carrier protein [Clostridiaceae bacterium]